MKANWNISNVKGNQPWIFIGKPDAEAEALGFWSTDANSQLIGKVPILGKIEGRRRRGHQRLRWLDGITDAMDMNLGKLWEMVRVREAWPAAIHGVTRSWTQLGDWPTTGQLSHSYHLGNSKGFRNSVEQNIYFLLWITLTRYMTIF